MNINGNFNLLSLNSLNGKTSLGNIKCKTINTDLISNAELNTLDGIDTTKTIQSQINTITGMLSNTINGGGFFMLYAESPSISTIVNSGYNWEFGSASNSNKGVVIGCDCYINHIGIATSGYPTNNTTVKIMKSSDNSTYSDTGLSISLSTSQTYNTVSSLNYLISKGTIINFQTTAGSGSVICRISVTFSSIGVKGDTGVTPTFTIGAVNTLPFGSTPSVVLTGTQENPVLNFNLITGPENSFINENMQGILYDTPTDTTTIDNNLIVKKTVYNRGDGFSIYATSNIGTTNDIYMNCYTSNNWFGTRTYNYYKLYDFICAEDGKIQEIVNSVGSTANNALNTANQAVNDANNAFNKAGDAQNAANNAKSRADDAYDKASDAEAVGASALALATANAAVSAGIGVTLSATNATVLAHTGQLAVIDTNLSALNGKTLKMDTATATGSKFIDNIDIYSTSNPISSVIQLSPNTTSYFGNGLEVAETLTANEISCDKIGCNEFNLSGNLNLPNSDATFKDISCNQISISGNLNLPNSNATFKDISCNQISISGNLNLPNSNATFKDISCNQISISGSLSLPNNDATFKSVTTSGSSLQTIDGSVIYIGHLGTPVYIGGLLYNPIANFFSQW